MIKAVFDTNIFVSSFLLEQGNPHKLAEMALDRKIIVFTSLEILEELEKVLERDFEEPVELINRQISIILEYATVIRPSLRLNAVKDDPDDNKILECAVTCNADYVVTGDKHLLDLKNFTGTRIVTAREFLEIVKT